MFLLTTATRPCISSRRPHVTCTRYQGTVEEYHQQKWIDEYLNEAHSQGLLSVGKHGMCATTQSRWTVRHFSGLRYLATKVIFRQRRVSIPSSNKQPASLRRKPTIWILHHRSVSRWQTTSVESRCT